MRNPFERDPQDDPIMFWVSRVWVGLGIAVLIGFVWSLFS